MTLPIIFVSSHARPGGSERYLVTLLDQLGSDHVRDVVVLEEGPLVDKLRSSAQPVTVIPTSARRSSIVLSALRLRRLVKHSRPALVHANGVKAALVTSIALLGTDVPLVWLKHDVSRDGRAARWIASRCARVVGVSEFVMQIFGNLDEDPRYTVVHTGFEPPAVDSTAARRKVLALTGTDEPARIVGMVGRLDRYKGHRDLVEAASLILEQHPDTLFLLVGGDDAAHPDVRPALLELVEHKKVEEAVLFTDHRDDAIELMAGIDIGVIPSRVHPSGWGREGFPMVGLEFLAVETPVVGYDAGGIPELIGDCGLLVPEGNLSALAKAICDLLDDDARRNELATCGRRRVETQFALESWKDSLRSIYRDVVP
ncbi:MAG TPA: glycosyltransferase [Actinomycetota bacterium]|nr:glycosyltransferase [Actinomycetota bacterium]